MARRTPLEVAIARQTEKQARYEGKLRDAGLTKVCVWVPTDFAAELKEIARAKREETEQAARLSASFKGPMGSLE